MSNKLFSTLSEPIANIGKNVSEPLSKNIGTTLGDIWFLVFGGISQAAEKRKIKYAYSLQQFERELNEAVAKIPEEQLVEPDIHIIAQALESAKYSVEKEELRHMFVKLITRSLTNDYQPTIHPIYVKIINDLTPYDAKTLYNLSRGRTEDSLNFGDIIRSLSVLMQLGLLYFDPSTSDKKGEYVLLIDQQTIAINLGVPIEKIANIQFINAATGDNSEIEPTASEIKSGFRDFILDNVTITKLGHEFIRLCMAD